MSADVALVWARTAPDAAEPMPDFTATIDGELAGRIYRVTGGAREGLWSWTAHGIPVGPAVLGCPLYGEVEAKQDAADQVRRVWRQWGHVQVMLAAGETADEFADGLRG